MISFKELVGAGVHFGHETSRGIPNMLPYIWGVKNKVHLIDVSKTAMQMERSAAFLKEIASEGKQILWVGTKKPAREIIKAAAHSLDMPYVNHRWIGGTLSNFTQVKKSVTRLLHYEDVLAKTEKYPHYTKKELNEILKKVEKLTSIVGGIRNLTWPLGAIVLVDVNKEQSGLKEAVNMGVPVVALVDTNADPSLVDYVIPANDDAPRSIRIIIDYLARAAQDGKEAASRKKSDKAAAAAQLKEQAAANTNVELPLEFLIEEDVEEDDATKESKSRRVQSVAKSIKKEAFKEDGEDLKKKEKISSIKKSSTTFEK